MKYLLILMVSLIMIGCCASRKAPIPKEETKETITERIQYVVKDTAIFIPGDTVRIETAIPCPDIMWHTVAKGNKSKITASLNKGKLTVECITDSLTQRIQYLEKRLERKSQTVTTITEVVPKEVIKNKVPKLIWWIIVLETGMILFAFRVQVLWVVKKLLLKI